jgi:hypothetical protein
MVVVPPVNAAHARNLTGAVHNGFTKPEAAAAGSHPSFAAKPG